MAGGSKCGQRQQKSARNENRATQVWRRWRGFRSWGGTWGSSQRITDVLSASTTSAIAPDLVSYALAVRGPSPAIAKCAHMAEHAGTTLGGDYEAESAGVLPIRNRAFESHWGRSIAISRSSKGCGQGILPSASTTWLFETGRLIPLVGLPAPPIGTLSLTKAVPVPSQFRPTTQACKCIPQHQSGSHHKRACTLWTQARSPATKSCSDRMQVGVVRKYCIAVQPQHGEGRRNDNGEIHCTLGNMQHPVDDPSRPVVHVLSFVQRHCACFLPFAAGYRNAGLPLAKLPIFGSTPGSSPALTPNQPARVAANWSTEVLGNNRP